VKKLNLWFLRCEGWKARKFEFGGVCTWPRLAVHHGIARLLGGKFCEKMKFVVFEM